MAWELTTRENGFVHILRRGWDEMLLRLGNKQMELGQLQHAMGQNKNTVNLDNANKNSI